MRRPLANFPNKPYSNERPTPHVPDISDTRECLVLAILRVFLGAYSNDRVPSKVPNPCGPAFPYEG